MTSHDGAIPARPLPLVDLQLISQANRNELWISPPADAEIPSAFEPFRMPHMTTAQMLLLGGLIECHYHRTGRCMVILLLLNTRERSWHYDIPQQRCAIDGVAWRLDTAAVPADHRIVGVFESAVMQEPAEAATLVMPMVGIHIINAFWSATRSQWVFARLSDGTVRTLDLMDLLDDEVGAMLDAHADRLQSI